MLGVVVDHICDGDCGEAIDARLVEQKDRRMDGTRERQERPLVTLRANLLVGSETERKRRGLRLQMEAFGRARRELSNETLFTF